MHCFISAGEPSGDLHGGNLARALTSIDREVEITGLGGPCMKAADVAIHYPLAERAAMGVVGVLRFIPGLVDVVEQLTAQWQRRRPDVVVLIDYPGFHWHLAARAKAMEIPVISFVPPQIWAWASYRANRMRRTFDHVLCTLPFEEPWFRSRGIHAHYVGHPYFDELAKQRLNTEFTTIERAKAQPIVALLPGSRGHEVHDNMPVFRRAARHIAAQRPDVRFLVAAFRDDQAEWLRSCLANEPYPIDVHVGRTPDIISLATACIAVSGSVGLELLYREVPTAVVYRTSMFYRRIFVPAVINVPYISIVNLLADRRLFPEYLMDRNEAQLPAEDILRLLNDPATHFDVVDQLRRLRGQVARPGACAAAANFLYDRYGAAASKAA